jgi:hypothetical protein
MDIRMDELDNNHEVLVSRVEDFEDNMQVVKTDVDVLRIEMSSFNKDIRDVEMLVDNVHLCLEKVEDCVDGFMSLLHSQTGVAAASSYAALYEAQRMEKELRSLIEGVRATLCPDASRGDCPSQTLHNEGTLAI